MLGVMVHSELLLTLFLSWKNVWTLSEPFQPTLDLSYLTRWMCEKEQIGDYTDCQLLIWYRHDSNVWKPHGVLYLPYRYAELAWWTREMNQLLWTLTSSIHALNSRVSKHREMGLMVTDRGTTRRTCRFHQWNFGLCGTKERIYFIFL